LPKSESEEVKGELGENRKELEEEGCEAVEVDQEFGESKVVSVRRSRELSEQDWVLDLDHKQELCNRE